MQRTNLELDEKLVIEALRLTRFKTKQQVVNCALRELAIKKRRKELLGLAGKMKWEGSLEQMRKPRA